MSANLQNQHHALALESSMPRWNTQSFARVNNSVRNGIVSAPGRIMPVQQLDTSVLIGRIVVLQSLKQPYLRQTGIK